MDSTYWETSLAAACCSGRGRRAATAPPTAGWCAQLHGAAPRAAWPAARGRGWRGVHSSSLPYVLANPPADECHLRLAGLHAAHRLFVLAPPAAEPTSMCITVSLWINLELVTFMVTFYYFSV